MQQQQQIGSFAETRVEACSRGIDRITKHGELRRTPTHSLSLTLRLTLTHSLSLTLRLTLTHSLSLTLRLTEASVQVCNNSLQGRKHNNRAACSSSGTKDHIC